MARLVSARCPNCGAHVKLDPTQDFVTCTYCGTSALIERDPSRERPVGTPVIVVPPSSSAPLVAIAVAVLVLAAASAGLVVWLSAGKTMPRPPIPGIAAPPPTAAKPAAPRYYANNRRPMFADFDGDGATDFVFSFHEVGKSGDAYGGFDGKSGKLLWKTAELGSAAYQHSAALVGGRLLLASPTGELTAYVLRDGARQWTTTLGDKAKRFCADGQNVRVLLSDGRALGIDLATGKQSPADAKAECHDTQRDDALRLPPSRTGFALDTAGPEQTSWRCVSTTVRGSYNFFVPDPCPKQLGLRSSRFPTLNAKGMVQTPDGWAIFGTRPEGTESPMVGFFGKGRLLWSAALHPDNPLAARPGSPKGVVTPHTIVASYTAVAGSEEHVVAFGLASGKRLWDVKAPWSVSQMAGTDDAIALLGTSKAMVLAARDGRERFRFGND